MQAGCVRRPEAQRGVTLIELMVAIVMLAILAAMAVPSFVDFRERAIVRGVAEQLLTQVSNARFEAVKRNADVRVTVIRTSETEWCLGASEGSAAACDCTVRTVAAANYCELGYFPQVDGDLQGARMAAVNGFDFVINPALGTLTNIAAANDTTLQAPTRAYQLAYTVSPLAHGRICVPAGKPAISGYDDC